MITEPDALVWITGANGLIGSYLVQTARLRAPAWRVRGLTRKQLDLLDFSAVEREFKKERPQLIIHCAAITAIAEAIKNPALARRLNCDVTRLLAGLIPDNQMVFFSTDLVFDGSHGNYVETDTVNPISLYGETKVIAEQIVLDNPRHLVVRTSINGGASISGKRGFNEQLRGSLQAAAQGMTLFNDEIRSPLPASETARAVWDLALKGCSGIFHVAGAEKLSRWEIGQLLIRRWPEVKTTIKSGSARDFAGPPRALNTSLDISKAQKVLTVPLPGLTEWLSANPEENF
jgi:dTDP-4-dehydrorhamnose reductase